MRRIDHTSRGVLPNVARLNVWSKKEELYVLFLAVENKTKMRCNVKKINRHNKEVDRLLKSLWILLLKLNSWHAVFNYEKKVKTTFSNTPKKEGRESILKKRIIPKKVTFS
jgi:hypothetical protein